VPVWKGPKNRSHDIDEEEEERIEVVEEEEAMEIGEDMAWKRDAGRWREERLEGEAGLHEPFTRCSLIS